MDVAKLMHVPERVVPPEPVHDLDWDPKQARELGERAVAIWEESLRRLRGDLPVARRHAVRDVREGVLRPIPESPVPLDELAAHLSDIVLNYSIYPGHPGFMAYISGAGTVPSAPADLLAAGMNQNVGGWRLSPAATEIELYLTHWFAEQFGFPETGGGIFTTGGAMAGFVGLKCARDARAGWNVRDEGVAAGPRMTIYASQEAHVVNSRAADMLGLGKEAVRLLPTDDGFRLRVDSLRRAIEADLQDGLRPLAVVATAGTTATGSIDPIAEIADVCKEYRLWLHVDAAYGGAAVLVPALRPLFAGIERADSIVFDPHKWLYTSHSGGCILLRDAGQLTRSFFVDPSYAFEDKELTGRGTDLFEMGPQFSRGFYGLKVWVSLLAHGRAAYVRRIAHDVDLAEYLDARVRERPEFEPMGPVTLSIACFRYVPPNLPHAAGREEYLDRLNERLMTEIQMDGRVYPSNAVLRGRFALRACIVNFRTEAEDVDRLLNVAAELGQRLDAELRPEGLQ